LQAVDGPLNKLQKPEAITRQITSAKSASHSKDLLEKHEPN